MWIKKKGIKKFSFEISTSFCFPAPGVASLLLPSTSPSPCEGEAKRLRCIEQDFMFGRLPTGGNGPVDLRQSGVTVDALPFPHCLSKSLSTAPPLASADTGTGVKVGRASEMGFISRWPPGPPEPESRGTAAERGARKGLDSPGRLAGTVEGRDQSDVRRVAGWLVWFHELPERLLT